MGPSPNLSNKPIHSFPTVQTVKTQKHFKTRVGADGAVCVYIWALPLCFTVFPCLHRAVYQKNFFI